MAILSKGHLNPGHDGVHFERFQLGLDALVRHVWVVRWDVPAGEVRLQRMLTYPACNVVVQPGGATFHGPQRSVSTRELRDRSWAVGVLLRPAATTLLTSIASERLVGAVEPVPGAPRAAVEAAMAAPGGPGLDRLADVLHHWLAPFEERVDHLGRLANDACRLAEERFDLLRVDELARELATTPRTLNRIVKQATGLTPKWLIECRRLQHAATTLFAAGDVDLAGLANELGYADQSHFTRRYRQVLGETPDQTRRAGREARGVPATERRGARSR